MSGRKKKSVYAVGSSSLADEMKNSLKFEEDDELRRNSGKFTSVSSQNVHSVNFAISGSKKKKFNEVGSKKKTVNEGKSASVEEAMTPAELNIKGCEYYEKGDYEQALTFFDKAIASSPDNGPLHCNRAGPLIGLMRYSEAIKECEEAIRLAPTYFRAHERLGTFLLCLGQVENARKHLCFQGHKPDEATSLKLQEVSKHIKKCTNARKLEDWPTMLKEAKAAINSGAELSSQLFACQAEAHLKLHQLDEARACMHTAMLCDPSAPAYKSKHFGILTEAYIYFVLSQIHTAFGRFDKACTAIERAARVDPQNAEVIRLLKKMKLVGKGPFRGNDLFHAGRYTEACSAYDEELTLDSSNSILYCDRAACWSKLGEWEKSLADSNQALFIQPDYTKALSRRAISNLKLERWADAVRDYKSLRQEHPDDRDIADFLSHARAELKKSRREGKMELVSDLEKFQAAIASGVSVVLFKEISNLQCSEMSSVVDALSTKYYSSVRFLKVDVELSPAIAASVNITTVPRVTIHKKGSRMSQLTIPRTDLLESMIKKVIFAPN
ncbi:hypothetical protein KY290_004697 [Solanum tuberosum]|nr:hypothetical protein KY284_006494 [Solanum tuberosum]KAH0753151.1 hypothetical protein KY285_006299 [Solanum tuberosum]KAH0778270.1 hypothetical protein KY290_004697 [Solanum tuberosum]